MIDIFLKSPENDSEWAQYYEFRWLYLRKPLSMPRGSERDTQESISFHCAAFTCEHKILGVGRISPCSDNAMQIRYMAVDNDIRHQGVGSMILQNLVEHAKNSHTQLCWLNARSDVYAFYQANGFEVIESVETNLPIAHYRMQLIL